MDIFVVRPALASAPEYEENQLLDFRTALAPTFEISKNVTLELRLTVLGTGQMN